MAGWNRWFGSSGRSRRFSGRSRRRFGRGFRRSRRFSRRRRFGAGRRFRRFGSSGSKVVFVQPLGKNVNDIYADSVSKKIQSTDSMIAAVNLVPLGLGPAGRPTNKIWMDTLDVRLEVTKNDEANNYGLYTVYSMLIYDSSAALNAPTWTDIFTTKDPWGCYLRTDKGGRYKVMHQKKRTMMVSAGVSGYFGPTGEPSMLLENYRYRVGKSTLFDSGPGLMAVSNLQYGALYLVLFCVNDNTSKSIKVDASWRLHYRVIG